MLIKSEFTLLDVAAPTGVVETRFGDRDRATETLFCNIKLSRSVGQKPPPVPTGLLQTNSELRIGNHIDALPYSSERVDMTRHVGTLTGVNRWFNYPDPQCGDATGSVATYIHDLAGYPIGIPEHVLPSSDQWARASAQADTKALAGLRKALVNVPMLIKERVETVALAVDKVNQISFLIKKRQEKDLTRYFKTTFKNRRKVAKKIASEHLGFIFGLLPLIEEVEGIVEMATRPEMLFVRSKGRQTVLGSRGFPSQVTHASTANMSTYPHHSVIREQFTNYGVRTSLRMTIDVEVFSRLRELGFNPVGTAYDFVPLSFIAGWVSNFSSWIRTFDPLVGLTFRTGARSTRLHTILNQRVLPGLPKHDNDKVIPYSSFTVTGGSMASCTKTTDNRIPLMALPAREFFFENNFNVYNVTAGFSLMIQRKLKLPLKAIKVKPFRYKSRKPLNLPPIKYRSS